MHINLEALRSIERLQVELGTILSSIDAKGDYIARKVAELYGPGTLEWWNWKYYEGEDGAAAPPFSVRRNVAFKQNEMCGYYINTAISAPVFALHSKYSALFLDESGKEFNLYEACPLNWLMSSDERFEKELLEGFERAKAYLIKRSETKKETAADKKEKDAEIRKQAVAKLTPEEQRVLRVKP